MAEDTALTVVFDRERPIYLPGESVSGRIVCDNAAPIRGVSAIRCKFRGKTCVRITRVENTGPYGAGQVHTYKSKFYHIKEDQELLDVARQHHNLLPATTFTFPFSFEIPTDASPTFVAPSDMGGVEYYVKAVVAREKSLKERVFGRKKRVKTRPEYGVFVVATPDLAGNDPDCVGSVAQDLDQEKKSKAGGVLGWFGRPLYCSAKLIGGNAVKFGTSVTLQFGVDNQSSGKVDGISAKLEHVMHLEISTVEDCRIALLSRSATICSKKTDGRPIGKRTNTQNIELELRIPQSLPYLKPGAPPGRLNPFPESVSKALEKSRPFEFAWPYRHHASPTPDPMDTWLSRPSIKSYYQIVVKFKVRNGMSTRIKIPVTLHPGLETVDIPNADSLESDIDMVESSENLLLESGKGWL